MRAHARGSAYIGATRGMTDIVSVECCGILCEVFDKRSDCRERYIVIRKFCTILEENKTPVIFQTRRFRR